MEIGNEISHKIRSAIKAKLVELGAYVDEELPDYIMVMVANKKSQFQMSEDLKLFLNTNTEKFTTWLHALLQKLQSITSEPAITSPTTATTSSKTEKGAEKSIEKKSREHTSTSESSSKSKKHAVDDEKSKPDVASERPTSESKKESKRHKSDQDKKELAVEKTYPPDDAKSKQSAVEPDTNGDDAVIGTTENLKVCATQIEATVEDSNANPPELAEAKTVIADHVEVKKLEVPEVKDSRQTMFDSDIQVIEDDDLSELLLTENDELAQELEEETSVVVSTTKKADSKVAPVIRISDDDEASVKPNKAATSIIMSRVTPKESSPTRPSRPKAVTSPIRQTVDRSAVVRAVEPRSSELLIRKRRAPVSVVGSISHDSDEDEGYDPRNPAVGNVASVVRVTARKSSVPPKLQASKSLLLKAMTEAEKSVETQRRVAITPVRPFMRSEGKERDRDREKSSRSAPSSSREPSHAGFRLAQAGLRQAIAQPGVGRKSEPPVYIPTRKVQPAPRVDSCFKIGIVSRSKRQEVQQRAWLDEERETTPPRKFIKREKDASIVNFVIETELDTEATASKPQPQSQPLPIKIKQEPVSPERTAVPAPTVKQQPRKAVVASEIDSRVVQYEPEIVASPGDDKSESGSQGVPVLLEDMDHEEFVLDQDVIELAESSAPTFKEDLRQTMMKDKTTKDKTRFVVTLDGVDTDQYEMEVTENVRLEEDMVIAEAQPSGADRPQAAAHHPAPQPKEAPKAIKAPPKIQPLNISLKDSDEEGEAMEEESTPLKRARMLERCKFWPACVNGAACDYHHPTVHCKTFPLCKFGEKCLYIHPNCRYDSKCARPDCPYTHSSRRSIPAFQVPHIIPVYHPPPPTKPVVPSHSIKSPPQCKFFPACSNMSCPFFHPKPCRFGLACKNKDKGCPFYHPSLPTKDKLTWAASKGTASGTPAAVLATGAAKGIK